MKRMGTISLLALAAVVGVGGSLLTAGFLETYGDTTTGSDLVETLRSGWLAPTLAAVAAFGAAATARNSNWTWPAAVIVVGASVLVLALAGRAAIGAKRDGYFASPPCTASFGVSGAPVPGRLAEIQTALDALHHPAGFPGGGESGPRECSYALDLRDLGQARDVYRPELIRAGWRVTRDDASGLVAQRDHFTFRIGRNGGDPTVWVTATWSAASSS